MGVACLTWSSVSYQISDVQLQVGSRDWSKSSRFYTWGFVRAFIQVHLCSLTVL